eukprot:502424-Pyramimonas_sp.AAC.1
MISTAAEQPARCFIVFGGDLNDNAGVPASDYIPDEFNPVGELFPRPEHYCLKRIREFMEQYGLCLINTFVGGQDTYYNKTTSSRIDYFGAPR